MGNYKPKKTKYFGPVNVLVRLTPSDTKFLLNKIKEAIDNDTGANLIFLNWTGAISLTYSAERGEQLKFISFAEQHGFRVQAEQKGYKGSWSHIELVTNPKYSKSISEFLGQLHEG